MGEWIGDRAEEAVRSVYSRMKELDLESDTCHKILDTYDVPRYEEVGDMARPYSLAERIQLNHERNRSDVVEAYTKAGLLDS